MKRVSLLIFAALIITGVALAADQTTTSGSMTGSANQFTGTIQKIDTTAKTITLRLDAAGSGSATGSTGSTGTTGSTGSTGSTGMSSGSGQTRTFTYSTTTSVMSGGAMGKETTGTGTTGTGTTTGSTGTTGSTSGTTGSTGSTTGSTSGESGKTAHRMSISDLDEGDKVTVFVDSSNIVQRILVGTSSQDQQ